ncbi:uncharacterized protein LOC131625610 [Vicia villosa]|uniref:uncharacterized protein LOC131625610 n=1 Tax=Vicia villosa TaxID=3911 RepID=UPI00273C1CA7|nr:uncharacterized protein LOC131625610 [Vicia villosa]
MGNEVLDMAKRENRSCVVLKVDYDNAYDNIYWNYLKFLLKKMGFGNRWTYWMEGCVFNSSMSVLVNSLTGLTQRAATQGEFSGFRISNDITVEILQFVDDTVLLCDGSSNNLWSIKAILRGFRISSGLKVNFCKIRLYGVHVSDWLLSATSYFLVCGIDHLPFKFLGIIEGHGPRKEIMWKDVVRQSLKEAFPEIFNAATDEQMSVVEAGDWVENCWKWHFDNIVQDI